MRRPERASEEAHDLAWHINNLPRPAVALLAALVVVFIVAIGPYVAPQTAIRPVAQTVPTVQSDLPAPVGLPTAALLLTAVPAPVATLTPTVLPDGTFVLVADAPNASFDLWPDPTRLETALKVPAGTLMRFEGERLQGRCRVRLLDGNDEPHIWLDCQAIGQQP